MKSEILTKTQEFILNEIDEGKNVFITGPGGCGKSYMISKIIDLTRQKGLNTVVTATTGCASVLLGNNAKTLNSWAGIGLANKPNANIVKSILMNKWKRSKWCETEVLIIDEVSMLSKHMFDLLDDIGKIIRRSDAPFGGIQLICCGDFYQLPPIGQENNIDSKKFCFESSLWNFTFGKNQIILKKIFRQEGDETYKKILNQIRKGELSEKTCEILKSCISKINKSDINPVKLHPRRNIVDDINNHFNERLSGKSREYDIEAFESVKNGSTTEFTKIKNANDLERLMSLLSKSVNNKLILKIGSQVMCNVNYDMASDKQICNGSCGIVINFDDNETPMIRFHNGRIITIGKYFRSFEIDGKEFGYSMIPLNLCWAMTIHKSQGCCLDIAEIDIGCGIFECGQTYVALSRVTSLEGLYLKSFDPSKIKIKKKVKDFYDNLTKKQ
jgi:ATP-dependent DNA helicase PIF1